VAQRLDLGHDGGIEHALGLQFVDERARHRGLLGRGPVDAAAVLRAHVGPLAVGRGGVVDREEDGQQLAHADHRRVVDEFDDLGAAGAAAAHVLIRRARGLPVAVARLDVEHAAHAVEHRLGAPKAAARQHQGFSRHGPNSAAVTTP
jgi:hypothetical protein